MSYYITVPINENGIVVDVVMNTVISEAMEQEPLDFRQAFVYSHGWSTDAVRASEFTRTIVKLVTPAKGTFSHQPENTFGVGIHWPSEITEDPNSPLNDLQLLTFYTMEHRAETVGRNGVYSILRLLLQSRSAPNTHPLQINLVGHSFGCRVVCAALQAIYEDVADGKTVIRDGTRFNAVLLQSAFNNDDLEQSGNYAGLRDLPTRILATFSSEDGACGKWYNCASELANLFHKPRRAMGSVGPTPDTQALFAPYKQVTPQPGKSTLPDLSADQRFVAADLSVLHKANMSYKGGASGHHFDINLPEIYELVTGFIFK